MNRLAIRVRRALGYSIGLLALVIAPTVRAQDVDPLSKLDQNSRLSIQLLIDSAETGGLPTSPLMSLVHLGIQRKADGRKIVDAVRNELRYLRVARTELGRVSDEELAAAADVLKAGAKPAQLALFRNRQNGRSDLEAFIVWADLMTRGVSSEDVSSAIAKLWQDGADEATFHSLWSNVQSDISLGLTPGAALQSRIRETPVRVQPKVSTPEGQEKDRAR